MCEPKAKVAPWLWAAAAAPFVVPVVVKFAAAGAGLAEGVALTVFAACGVLTVALVRKLRRPVWRPSRTAGRVRVMNGQSARELAASRPAIGAPRAAVVVLSRRDERVQHVQ